MALPIKKEGDHLGAGHVNKLTEAAERTLSMVVGGYGGGSNKGFGGLPPWVQLQCKVVAVGFNIYDDTGDDSEDPAQDDLYTIRVYYWNSITSAWTLDDTGEGFCLDDKLKQTGYSVDDKLTVYWDAQRNSFIPISSSSGSGVLSVRFRIVAATTYCAECYATARIISGPPDVTDPDSLPGTTYDYEAQYYTIKVYDMGEGWLNHPQEDLLNLIGHATWLRSYEDGPCSEYPGLHWEIIDLQDPEEEVCE